MTIQVRAFGELSVDEFFEIARLRDLVFHVEQRIDVEDLDDLDRAPGTRHWWLSEGDGAVVAYARSVRLQEPEHGATASLGRVAVRADRRGRGLAGRLIAAILEQFSGEPVVIHSQSAVIPLYEGFGFRPVGEEFPEAGIPHRSMVLDPQPGSSPRIHVSAVLLTDPEGRVLMVRKRGTTRFLNPGGKPEPSETPAQCAAREVAEELGIQLDPQRLIPLGRIHDAAANEPGHIVVAEVFAAAEPVTEVPQPRAEIEEVRLVDPNVPQVECAPLFLNHIRYLL